jgi:hypothetical protein
MSKYWWGLIIVVGCAILVYFSLLIRAGWVQKNGGVGLQEMSYKDYPASCRDIVNLHVGSGNSGVKTQLDLGPRTFVLDMELLKKHPECWAHSILAGVGFGGRADYRVIFRDLSNKQADIEMTIKY